MSTPCIGYGARSADAALAPLSFERRALRDDDVAITIDYCGVCHSDLHQVHNDWRNTTYPCVPGHEIIGTVSAVGALVKKFKLGERVAVGCLVDSCQRCAPCEQGEEQHCVEGVTLTYNGRDRQTGDPTYGGYSDHVVVRERFVLRVPQKLDIKFAAPLLCAGITVWTPLRQWGVKKGAKVAVVGLGGLGHLAVKLAAALGAEVTMITSSPSKGADARALGAAHVLLSSDKQAMKGAADAFDLIVDTIPTGHNVGPYLGMLRLKGALVVVGAIDTLEPIHSWQLLHNQRALAGSAIGGIAATQELLDFCAQHDILPECEMIAMRDINRAYERMQANDVKYRFVIDMSTLKA